MSTSRLNYTSTSLLSNQSYKGAPELIESYNTVCVTLYTDVDGVLKIHYSNDAESWIYTDTFPVVAGSFFKSVEKKGNWFRIEYVNGNVAQQEFRLDTHFKKDVSTSHVLWEIINAISELKKLDKEDEANSIVLLDNVSVYADSLPIPVADPVSNRDGWFYTNTQQGNKFNYYYGGMEGFTLQNITTQYAILTLDNISPQNVVPHFVLYTVPTGVNDAGSWYHSRIVYIVENTQYLGFGEKVMLYWGIEPTIKTDLRRVLCIKDNVSSVGEQGDNELILTISIQSDSSATPSDVKVLLEMAGFSSTTLDKTRKVLFKNTRKRDIENNQLINTDATLQLILSAINNMGNSTSSSTGNNTLIKFKTDYINTSSGVRQLENDETGIYHLLANNTEIKQIRVVQRGEVGIPTYSVVVKVWTNNAGILSLASTHTNSIPVGSINGMNSINYYTNEPTKQGLVFHFPCDYSIDSVMGDTTIHGGSLVNQPRLGFRSYSSGVRMGCHTSIFDLASYGNAWTICFWCNVINQNPTSAFVRLLTLWDTNNNTATEQRVNGFSIELRNNAYNTKPYVDYRVLCYNSSGSAIPLTSAQADYGTGGSTGPFFNNASGQIMNTWTHLAFQKVSATDYKFYQNGVLVADISTGATIITSPSATSIQFGGTQYLYHHNSSMLFDDIRFYDNVLDATEIAKFGSVSTSNDAGGMLLTDLSPTVSCLKNQLVSVEATETTTASNDRGTEELKVDLLGINQEMTLPV